MKRILLCLFCLLLFPCAGFAEETPFRLTATVMAEDAAIMALPTRDSKVLLPLFPGDSLVVTALGTSWCEAVCGDRAGYVATEAIVFDILCGQPTRLAVITYSIDHLGKSRLTLRSEASRKSAALRKLSKGTIVLLMEEAGEMVHVVLPDIEGYVLKDYVEDVAPQADYRIAYVEQGEEAWLRLDSIYAKTAQICILAPGTPVQFFDNPNGWAVVEAAGYRGRMLAHRLTFDAPELPGE